LSYDHLKYASAMDAETLEALMREYGQEVWNFAYLICRNRSMADDISQETFLRAYRHIASFRGEASVKTWLLRIARNLSYNYRNSAFFRKALLLDRISPKGQNRSAEQAFLDEEATNEVWRRVFRLSAKQQGDSRPARATSAVAGGDRFASRHSGGNGQVAAVRRPQSVIAAAEGGRDA